ncbi:conserved hypothetical protein [Vibrio crassostreae]|nr:conserved hypothetical protein [Vibrio crassostreae]
MNNKQKLQQMKEALISQRKEIVADLNDKKDYFSNSALRNSHIDNINNKVDGLCEELELEKSTIKNLDRFNEKTIALIDETLSKK